MGKWGLISRSVLEKYKFNVESNFITIEFCFASPMVSNALIDAYDHL